ncbi:MULTISPECIES: hypothetical protein [Vibrio]|uniref:Uncharacterized protein n=1 Tax=Vibrio mediterranei TaxID=689 RepID=A0AAJ3BU43_9VIBR|nr:MULTISPECIES: hypothetical protein [Vibrio]ASI90213.1 hypothetical protein BSZ05_10760 [Vibrio mediterranei]EDL51959.1 hypothetical protein VSAK1_02144 [Vibrio mediterranei AK1]MCF4175836.1 hypothetical protein [Vibrio sp. McD22-P3]MCG9656413.1 hypothetical protein [Vibrio mediterranei]MCY9851812.1 hypothetical protein [Vibrio mediterranei]
MKVLKDIAISSIITTVVMLVLNASWDWVFIASLEVAVYASVVLTGMLKGAISLEKVMASYFLKHKTLPKLKRGISSYIILVGSKFLAMGIIAMLFGQHVAFTGAFGGVVAFFAIIFAVLGLEGVVAKLGSKARLA